MFHLGPIYQLLPKFTKWIFLMVLVPYELYYRTRTRREVIFSLCQSTPGGVPQPGPGGGLPRSDPAKGEYPGQVQSGGTWDGVPPGQVRMGVPEMGYPLARSGWGTWDGVPLAKSGWGYLKWGTRTWQGWGNPQPGQDRGVPEMGIPLWQGWGTPWPVQDRGVPKMGYPREGWGTPRQYRTADGVLIRRDRYASCVHAGGLSCFLQIFVFFLETFVATWAG